jgi:hypothetical protein
MREGTPPEVPPDACGQQAAEHARLIPMDAGPEFGEHPRPCEREGGVAHILVSGRMRKQDHARIDPGLAFDLSRRIRSMNSTVSFF